MCPNANSVAILLATYNGAEFLVPQLNSIKEQSYCSWQLYVSDDGSSDSTLTILKEFSHNSQMKVYSGPQKGFAENFLSLIGRDEIKGSYYAFSDQDDIWCDDKLKRAVDFLIKVNDDLPALYCSRTILVDSSDKIIGHSALYKKRPDFPNALLQNIASGNTMVFNDAARRLFLKILDLPVIAHDWALYLIVSACGGNVFFDPQPSVFYRQHNANVIGNGMKLTQRVSNFIDAHQGRNRHWNDVNFRFLTQLKAQMTPENRGVFEAFRHIRDNTLPARLKLFKASGVYHQNRVGQMTNFSYALFNKF